MYEYLPFFSLQQQPVKSIKLQVKPHLLYKPNLNSISVRPDAKATFELFDRVVIGRQGYSVPLGARGTVIGIEPLIDVNPVRQENINAVEYFYVILFDESIEYGSSIFGIAEKKVFKVRQSVLINISYGTGKMMAINRLNINTKLTFLQFLRIFRHQSREGSSIPHIQLEQSHKSHRQQKSSATSPNTAQRQ